MIRLLLADAREGANTVRGAGHHYLVHVHRVRAGDAVDVFDGRGSSFEGLVRAASDEAVELELSAPAKAPSVRPITLVQGMPKADKLELVIQKASELWATAVVPAFCERSVVKATDSDARKLARWQKIADEAARQCGRSEVLRVEAARPLADAVPKGALVLDEDERTRTLSSALVPGPLTLVVGPEGGFSDAERNLFASRGAIAVTLGRLVLRTETAGLAALSVVRHLDGLLG